MVKYKVKIGDGSTSWENLPYIGGENSSKLHNNYDQDSITIDSNTTENHVYIISSPISQFTINIESIMASESIVSFKAGANFSLTVAGAQASNIRRIGSFTFNKDGEYIIFICGNTIVSSIGSNKTPSILNTEFRMNEMSDTITTETTQLNINDNTIVIPKNIHDVVHIDFADYRIENDEHLKFTLAVLSNRNTNYKTDDIVGCVNSDGSVDWTYTSGTSEKELFAVKKSDAVLYACDTNNMLYIYDSVNDVFKLISNNGITETSVMGPIYANSVGLSSSSNDDLINENFMGIYGVTPRKFFLENAPYFEHNNYSTVFSATPDYNILSIYNDNGWNWLTTLDLLKRLRYGSAEINSTVWQGFINADNFNYLNIPGTGFKPLLNKYKIDINSLPNDKILVYDGKILKEQLGEHEHVEIDKFVLNTKNNAATCTINIKDDITTYISNIDCSNYSTLTLSYDKPLNGKEWIVYLSYDASKTTPVSIALPSELKIVGAIPDMLPDTNTIHIISIHDKVVVFGTAKKQ